MTDEYIPDWEIVEMMHRAGGSFVQALARCYQAADYINQQRLRDAFPEVWRQYRDLAMRAIEARRGRA
jgi:hypothetical protein